MYHTKRERDDQAVLSAEADKYIVRVIVCTRDTVYHCQCTQHH